MNVFTRFCLAMLALSAGTYASDVHITSQTSTYENGGWTRIMLAQNRKGKAPDAVPVPEPAPVLEAGARKMLGQKRKRNAPDAVPVPDPAPAGGV